MEPATKPALTEYAIRAVTKNRATVCEPTESRLRWWGPPGYVAGERIWHGDAIVKLNPRQR